MPEGHTLHRLAQLLDHAFAGTTPAVSSPQGRFAAGAALLDGQEVTQAQAWGKHLGLQFASQHWLHVHLGLIGKMSVTAYTGTVPPPVGQVRLRLASDQWVSDLRGAMLCQVREPGELAAITAKLGPDPLRVDADPEQAWARMSRSSKSVAELLMDQSVLAGVGNLYRAEVLFRQRVSPVVPGRELRRRSWEAIWADLVALMRIGVAYGQIITMPDQVAEAQVAMTAGEMAVGVDPEPMERRFMVYQREGEPCRQCGARIQRQVLAGRNLFWCARCQRRR